MLDQVSAAKLELELKSRAEIFLEGLTRLEGILFALTTTQPAHLNWGDAAFFNWVQSEATAMLDGSPNPG